MSEESTSSESEPENTETAVTTTDVGPDPVWGVAIGAFGLLNMAIGGALTRHYWFNFGEVFMLTGAAVFLASVAITNAKQGGLPTFAEMRERVVGAFRKD